MNRLFLLVSVSLISLYGFAQNEQDAIRYSLSNPLSSARGLGMGAATGALGAEMSGMAINPGGLGLYRRNEFQASGGLMLQKAQSNYLGTLSENNQASFRLPSLGLVFTDLYKTKGKEVNRGLVSNSFFVGFNNLAQFGRAITLEGNNNNSIVERFQADAQGTPYFELDPNLYTGMAWSIYLIDTTDGQPDRYISPMSVDSNFTLRQATDIQQKGSMNEFMVGAGANLSNRFYVGGGLSIPYVNFNQTIIYEEFDETESQNGLKNMAYIQRLKTSGYGVSLKLGAIFKPTDMIRFGLAYHTPFNLRLDDSYDYSLSAGYDNGVSLAVNSTPGVYNYKIRVPGKLVASALIMVEQFGLISADYEYSNYQKARLSAEDFTFTDANAAINSYFQAGSKLRIGTEWRIQKIYYLRAGYNWQGSPYSRAYNLEAKDNIRQTYTAGAGINLGEYMIDIAYARSVFNEYNSPYLPVRGPAAFSNTRLSADIILAGIKYRF